jgi:hypothetical protein
MKLEKCGTVERCAAIREMVRYELEKYSSKTELITHGDRYWIDPFAQLRYSMWLPFSRTDFILDELQRRCYLVTALSWRLAAPFAIFACGLAIFALTGPITATDAVIMMLIPTFLIVLAVADSSNRLRRWWEAL